MVVLGVQQEVGADDRDADCHDGEDEEHQQHEAVDVVHLPQEWRSEGMASANVLTA